MYTDFRRRLEKRTSQLIHLNAMKLSLLRKTLCTALLAGGLLWGASADGADTGKIVYQLGNGSHFSIYLINGDGTDNHAVTTDANDYYYPELSPDGKKIAYNINANGIYLMNADGTGAGVIPNTGGLVVPSWSADSKKLAAVDSSTGQVSTFNVDGSGLRAITSDPNLYVSNPGWSPDGTKIVFAAVDFSAPYGNKYQIYIVPADGATAPVRLTTDTTADYEEPSWSPDGKKIACRKGYAIYTLNPTTGAETRVSPVTSNPNASDLFPTFSPDGTEIAFQDFDAGAVAARMNLDGSNRRPYDTNMANTPKWSRAGEATGGGQTDDDNFNVPGTSNIWLAGAAKGTTASNGQDTLVNASPFQAPITLVSGKVLTFSASGSVSNDPAKPNGTGPDGGPYNGVRFYNHAIENHIASLTAPINSLIGVFLNDATPAGSIPSGLDFNGGVTGGTNFTSISPALKQPFFIGDGVSDDGRAQSVVVPAGATRLFLGSLDPSQQSNNRGSFAVIVNPPAPPDHGGLSATTFTVNGSAVPGSILPSPILSFAGVQTGHPANLAVFVQVSITPNDAKSWTDLPDDKNGFMTFDASGNQFILNTTGYQAKSGQYFRARATASGYPDSVSNAVGPFDLSQAGAHIPPVVLLVSRNGTVADLDFTAGEISAPNNVALHIQTSETPGVESSWTPLADGHSGLMTRSTNANYPNVFTLLANDLPAGSGVYYRAVATLSGSLPSISNVTGPYVLTADTPPLVKLHPPTAQSGKGTLLDPYIVPAGQIKFSADATPDPSRHESKIASLKLTIDGSLINDANGAPASVDFSYTQLGDHVLQAIAIDDLGAISRAGSGTTIIRVVPASGHAIKGEHAPGSPVTLPLVAGKVFTVAKSGGKWSDASTWKDASGKPGVPGKDDLAIVGASTIVCDSDVVAGSVSLAGGRLTGGGTFDVYGTITISSGTFDGGTSLYIGSSGYCELLNSADVQVKTPTLINFGTINVQGSSSIKGVGQLINNGTINWNAPATPVLNATLDPTAGIRVIDTTSYVGTGNISAANLSGLIGNDGGGLVNANGGTLIGNAGGTVVSPDDASLIGQDGGGLIGQDGGGLIGQDGGGLIAAGGGNLIAAGGGNFQGESRNETAPMRKGGATETTAEAQAPTGFTQTGGTVDLSAANIIGPVTLSGGVLSGSGRILGNLTSNGGYISPGHSPGAIAVDGNFTQTSEGTLIVEDGGAFPSQYDQLQVNGKATLGGTLDIRTIDGYTPNFADAFSPLAYSSHSGKFATISSNAAVTLGANGLLATANPSAVEPATGDLVNIATRMNVGSGENVMIAGFIITGTGSKKVLIRGLGPELADLGIAGALADPTLELHEPNGTVVSNDNWKDTQQAAIIATKLAPTHDSESAIVATLAPGSYTAILAGKSSSTGVGLVEVYDLDGNSTVANIATRGIVQSGDNVLIGGVIVGGSEPAKVLLRATGPSLTPLGVKGALQDPLLELHDANGSVITNDDWRATQEADIIATNLAPTNPRESAILATLVPGSYTAIVRGKDGGTGVALVEAYNLK